MDIIKVLIADDHPVVRAGLSAMLADQLDINVVGEAANGLDAVNKAIELKPDVVLMDVCMPDLDGVAAMRNIRTKNPDIKFIILSTFAIDDYIFSSIEAGARGYILKAAPCEEVFKAIRAAYRGESVIEPTVGSKILSRFAELSHHVHTIQDLSRREMKVLELVAKGMANKEIAAHLAITTSTVNSHVQAVLQKLGVNTRVEAVTKAISKGIIHL